MQKKIVKKKPLINEETKIYRSYDENECKPVDKGVMPETDTIYTRLAYLDKSEPNCPLAQLSNLLD